MNNERIFDCEIIKNTSRRNYYRISLTLGACGNHDAKKTSDSTPKTEKTAKSDTTTSSSVESSVMSSVATTQSSAAAASVSNANNNNQAQGDPNVTPQQLGTMVCFLQAPDAFKQNLNDCVMGQDDQGFYYVDWNPNGGGDEHRMFYKRNGDQVTIKWHEGGAFGSDKTRVVSYHNLLQDYYQNANQKNEVNSDASQIKQTNQ